MTAPVVIRNATLALDPSQGHVPPAHTPPPASSMHVQYSPVFNQATPPSWGAGHALMALDRQQHQFDNLFAWEDWCHAGLWAENYTPLPVPNELGSLGSRENSIVIEDLDSPYVIPLPDRVPSPFTHTAPSTTPASLTLPIPSLENSPSLPVYYLPSEYFGDTLLLPTSTSNSRYYYSAPSATPPDPATSPSLWGIDPAGTSLASADIQEVLGPSEAELSELGYNTCISQVTMSSSEEKEEAEGGDIPADADINQQAKPQLQGLPEIILTWHEVRVDTCSEQEEEIEPQDSYRRSEVEGN